MPRKRLPDLTRKPRLAIAQILTWADENRRRHGTWTYIKAGPIEGVPGETWCGVNFALYGAKRGLRGKSSLAYLLLKRRNVVTRRDPLDEETIFRWALAHRQRTGTWPTGKSAAIHDAPAETWGAIDEAGETRCHPQSSRLESTISSATGAARATYGHSASQPHAR